MLQGFCRDLGRGPRGFSSAMSASRPGVISGRLWRRSSECHQLCRLIQDVGRRFPQDLAQILAGHVALFLEPSSVVMVVSDTGLLSVEAATGEVLHELDLDGGLRHPIAFSPSGEYLCARATLLLFGGQGCRYRWNAACAAFGPSSGCGVSDGCDVDCVCAERSAYRCWDFGWEGVLLRSCFPGRSGRRYVAWLALNRVSRVLAEWDAPRSCRRGCERGPQGHHLGVGHGHGAPRNSCAGACRKNKQS